MNKREERALVKETKARIKAVEAEDPEVARHQLWIEIQGGVRQLYEGRSLVATGKLISKGETWVGDVVRWDPRGPRTPFTGSEETRPTTRAQRGAKEVLADPKQRKKVLAELDSETRDDLIQDAALVERDPKTTRKIERHDDETSAYKQIDKALWALRARLEFYGDVPLNDHERESLTMIRTLLERLEAGVEMDDELKEMLEDATA